MAFKAPHELTLPQLSASSPTFSCSSLIHTNVHYSSMLILTLFPLLRMPSASHGFLFLSNSHCFSRPAPDIIFYIHSWTLHCSLTQNFLLLILSSDSEKWNIENCKTNNRSWHPNERSLLCHFSLICHRDSG